MSPLEYPTRRLGWTNADAFLGLLIAHPELNPRGRTLHVLKGFALTYRGYSALHPFQFNGQLYVD